MIEKDKTPITEISKKKKKKPKKLCQILLKIMYQKFLFSFLI